MNINNFVFFNLLKLYNWQYNILLPQLITLISTTFIIMILTIIYYVKINKINYLKSPKGIILFVEIFIKWIEHQIIDLMGPRYKFLTIYIIYLLLYIGIGNLFAIIGFQPIVTTYTIPLSMSIITFIGIYYFGLKYQKIFFFKKFINPIELLTQFVPLISLSFRLFGNILGGTIIISLITKFLEKIWNYIPYIKKINLLSILILPFLNLYFDIFNGIIQAYIFSILTLSYWSINITNKNFKIKNYNNERTKIKYYS